MCPLTNPARPGLRERKKMQTRRAIRQAAYRLFAEQGYDATPVDQIAAEADVSPSTVFRYFPTKEDIVLTDEYDSLMEEELRARPADEPPLDSLRYVLRQALGDAVQHAPDEVEQRSRLTLEVPAIRARMTENMSATGRMLARVLAERTGRPADDLEIRVFTSAVCAALMETTLYCGEHGLTAEFTAMADRTLGFLEGGLRL